MNIVRTISSLLELLQSFDKRQLAVRLLVFAAIAILSNMVKFNITNIHRKQCFTFDSTQSIDDATSLQMQFRLPIPYSYVRALKVEYKTNVTRLRAKTVKKSDSDSQKTMVQQISGYNICRLMTYLEKCIHDNSSCNSGQINVHKPLLILSFLKNSVLC